MSTELANRIRTAKRRYEARNDVDLTWEDLAALIGQRLGTKPVHKSTISKWLTGARPVDGESLFVIADLLEVDPRWLARGEGEPPALTPDATGARAVAARIAGAAADVARVAPGARPASKSGAKRAR